MRVRTTSRVLRALIIPIGAIVGLLAAPALLMPSPDDVRHAGQVVDGTGYGSAGIFGLFAGAVVGYVVRTVLDYTIWRAATDGHVDPAA
jgi:hypothetical protein